MQIIKDKICEAFDFTTEDLKEKGWGPYVDKAVALLSDEDTVAKLMAQTLLGNTNQEIETKGIDWCKANNVKLSILTKVHMMLKFNWTPEAEITILDSTFQIGTDDQMGVDRELVVEVSTSRYSATYWTYKNGDLVNVNFEHHGDHIGFGLPMTVTITRTPSIDNMECYDHCWQAYPTTAPIEEHAENCPFRRWKLGEYGDCNGETREYPDCTCDFECHCEPVADRWTRTVNSNNELFSEEFMRWYGERAL